ncbi:CopG family ribbon-helix-helix protein [Rhodococcus qingshengii]|uniref:CopG family transcriptional regulator n=1 Tax=Rhodococcus qingshengii TaxID=334542 RepID=A0A2A5J0T6_RHOSG|nr:hypothetical protein [Rhodococcus qingshengii]PCK23195.1 hypothetical protein CHR55_30735 [Rhodococcus qingshengii]
MDNNSTDYEALAAWAENDMNLPVNSKTAKRGADAAQAGRDLLERVGVGGRPSLGGKDASGTSPRRQVRLPVGLSARLDAIAAEQHRKPSDVMREAVEDYVRAHSA